MPGDRRKVLVLGASGMVGNGIFSGLVRAAEPGSVMGTIRNHRLPPHPWFKNHEEQLYTGVDVLDFDSFVHVVADFKPDVVINCEGLVKQVAAAQEAVPAITFNSVFPHRIAELCAVSGARMIHFTTDCVFKGDKGSYTEADAPDADDLYGRTKSLGEVVDKHHCLSVRTSFIGHELLTCHGLVDWFLSQSGTVKGYCNAYFSGLPTIEMVRVLLEYIMPREDLWGLYHVAADRISKYELLRLVAETYGKKIVIEKNETLVIDRSLNASKFNAATGYHVAGWPELVSQMHAGRHVEGVQ
jgi:dTDP-4-dehydrorhamnose reductase